jgi:hypothetical protein
MTDTNPESPAHEPSDRYPATPYGRVLRERDEARAEVERHARVVGTLNEMVERRDKRLAELEGIIRRVGAAATLRDVVYPPKFGHSPSENYVMGALDVRGQIRTALLTASDAPCSPVEARTTPEGTTGGPEAQEAVSDPQTWDYCGKGICALNDGHDGRCRA